jgi:hypothetical protein
MRDNKRNTLFLTSKNVHDFLRTKKPIPIAPRITVISTGDSLGVSVGQGVIGFSVLFLGIVVLVTVVFGIVVTIVVSVTTAESCAYTSVLVPAVTEIRFDQSR